MSRTVLCVDTDRRVSSVASTIDADDELTAVEATSLEQAAATLEREPIVGVVTAYELADGTGLDIVELLREQAPQTPCVLFTDVSPGEIDTASFEELIVEYLNRDLPDAHDRLGSSSTTSSTTAPRSAFSHPKTRTNGSRRWRRTISMNSQSRRVSTA